jgi:hypothetical protein
MMRSQRARYALASNDATVLATFRSAYSAAPVAVSTASALLVALGAMDVITASRVATIAVFALVVVSMITFTGALGARNERAFLSAVLLISAASAFADLPLHRSDAAVFAAVAGATVLGLIEAGGAALEPKGGGTHIGRPARLHVAWVVVVGVAGAAAGWLLLSLQSGVADLGLVAVAFGVLAAVGMIVFTGALTGSALGDTGRRARGSSGREATPVGGGGTAGGSGLNPPERRALSRRGRRLARGARRAPRDRPPR